jgi:hypothetical protein
MFSPVEQSPGQWGSPAKLESPLSLRFEGPNLLKMREFPGGESPAALRSTGCGYQASELPITSEFPVESPTHMGGVGSPDGGGVLTKGSSPSRATDGSKHKCSNRTHPSRPLELIAEEEGQPSQVAQPDIKTELPFILSGNGVYNTEGSLLVILKNSCGNLHSQQGFD